MWSVVVVERDDAVEAGLAEEEAEGVEEGDGLAPEVDELFALPDPSSWSSLARNAVASGVGKRAMDLLPNFLAPV